MGDVCVVANGFLSVIAGTFILVSVGLAFLIVFVCRYTSKEHRTSIKAKKFEDLEATERAAGEVCMEATERAADLVMVENTEHLYLSRPKKCKTKSPVLLLPSSTNAGISPEAESVDRPTEMISSVEAPPSDGKKRPRQRLMSMSKNLSNRFNKLADLDNTLKSMRDGTSQSPKKELVEGDTGDQTTGTVMGTRGTSLTLANKAAVDLGEYLAGDSQC